MRRGLTVLALTVLTVVAVSSPAYAFSHDKVANPLLHMVLDVLVLAAVTSPIWGTYLLISSRRRARSRS